MNENVLSGFLGNEAQAFLIVPPFNFAFSHNYLLNALTHRSTSPGPPDRHLGARRFVPSTTTARLSELPDVSQVVLTRALCGPDRAPRGFSFGRLPVPMALALALFLTPQPPPTELP